MVFIGDSWISRALNLIHDQRCDLRVDPPLGLPFSASAASAPNDEFVLKTLWIAAGQEVEIGSVHAMRVIISGYSFFFRCRLESQSADGLLHFEIPASITHRDLRDHIRVAVDGEVPMSVEFKVDGQPVRVSVMDVSHIGARIRLAEPLEGIYPSQKCSVTIALGDLSYQWEGVIMWAANEDAGLLIPEMRTVEPDGEHPWLEIIRLALYMKLSSAGAKRSPKDTAAQARH